MIAQSLSEALAELLVALNVNAEQLGETDLQSRAVSLHNTACDVGVEHGWDDHLSAQVANATWEVRAWVHRLTLLPAEDAGRPRLVALARTAAERVLALAELADYLVAPRAVDTR